MKKYILALCFTVLCLQISFSQGPPIVDGCECCNLDDNPVVETPEETACLDACDNADPGAYCSDVLPLDSNIFLLFGLAISFGAYSVYQNKKRLLNN